MIDKIRILNAVCLMKKLFNTIPKIRTKLFIEKLKNIKVNKSKYEKLKTSMKKVKNDKYDQHKIQITICFTFIGTSSVDSFIGGIIQNKKIQKK